MKTGREQSSSSQMYTVHDLVFINYKENINMIIELEISDDNDAFGNLSSGIVTLRNGHSLCL